MKVLVVIGTRPEVIKMAPVIHLLKRRASRFHCKVCVTGQHREMLDPVLAFFGIQPDFDLNIMRPDQTLADITARTLQSIGSVYESFKPDWVLVQGDTTTAMAAGLAAYYHQLRIGHVEAGLRTGDKYAPFPEEMNRRIIGSCADIHFAPTPAAARALKKEGVPASIVHVTGNPVIDALLWAHKRVKAKQAIPGLNLADFSGKKIVLVTGHRRESFGPGFERMCRAFTAIVRARPDAAIVYPVHLNPRVREPVQRLLKEVPGIHLIEPLAYPDFVALLGRAHVVLTDSGGVQEEAPSLGKPVLVMRDVTERMEGVRAGNARLVGTDEKKIVRETLALLDNKALHARMTKARNPYGDGKAAQRIVDALMQTSS
ncbi:MAG TPA: UDP-N-acetylglucosamine 2-epimerase (non-hydrolyzing) [Verrucomicrobia bacterium]|nr:MAG: UDP-N-acetylglucosamine 2-epimerase [Lentisphaerae bacterium GWF2_57_35]HBA86066.1 UDP-N-acetylglucosamine 2-epimerase (non-hydrolyzing) [Verrucomicrobiota bacterium]